MTYTELNLEKTPFIDKIRNELIEHEQGKFILATGAPGSGKSMAMIRLAEKIDENFSIDRISIGHLTPFIKLLQQANEGKLPHGSCILADEAGVFLPAREWHSAQNRILSLIFQVIRKYGLLVIFTVPAKRMIDIHGIILARYYGVGRGVNYKKKRSYFTFYELEYDDWSDHLYRHLLKDGNGEKVNIWEIALPQSIDFEEYERKKDEMIGKLLRKAQDIFTKIEGKAGGKEKKEKEEEKKKEEQKKQKPSMEGKRKLVYPRVPVLMKEFGISETRACSLLGVDQADYWRWKQQNIVKSSLMTIESPSVTA
ncbi:MAG: hypothetical protein DRP18_04705 [Candidatus Aenigmatarchaeota archaeon]|nr:MAG: hypothetical protein DRP18_04705 [Candidatus Aenigmarchaeota archaeon]